MAEFLYILFYLGVLTLIVGSSAYLIIKRSRHIENRTLRASNGESAPLSRAAVERVEGLSGSYRLSELTRILEELAAKESWGMVLELQFTTVQEYVQMVVNSNEVEILLDPEHMDLFRRAAREAGLQARTKRQDCIEVIGDWGQIASMIRSTSRSIYRVDDSEEVEVRIF
jgi:hypothetical protein